jgi:hypothetical protein
MSDKQPGRDQNSPKKKMYPSNLEKSNERPTKNSSMFSKVKSIKSELQNWDKGLRHYPNVSIEEGVNIVLRAGAKLNYTVSNADRQSGSISFQTGSKEKRWDGIISVTVLPTDAGVEILTSSRTEKGGIYNPMGISASASEGARAIKSAQLLGSIKMEMDKYQKNREVSSSIPQAQLSNATKTCPYCAEDIKMAAIKCKHCGSDI